MPLLLLLASFSFAAPVVGVSTATVQLGQPFGVQVREAIPAGATLELDLEKTSTDYFSISKAEPDKSAPGVWNLELVPLALGKLHIPIFFKLDYMGKTGGERADVAVDVVEPPMQGEGELADIKAPRAARAALWPWLLALAVFALAFWLWSRVGKAKAEGPREHVVVDHRPPEVIAEEALFTLEASGLWAEKRYKDFYLQLTDILRNYLERRYTMPATKLTTAELYKQMREAELDRAVVSVFRSLFDRADLVKFSKVEPEPGWGESALADARGLVAQTTPKPKPTTAEAAA